MNATIRNSQVGILNGRSSLELAKDHEFPPIDGANPLTLAEVDSFLPYDTSYQ